jgi:hypothetical protein
VLGVKKKRHGTERLLDCDEERQSKFLMAARCCEDMLVNYPNRTDVFSEIPEQFAQTCVYRLIMQTGT